MSPADARLAIHEALTACHALSAAVRMLTAEIRFTTAARKADRLEAVDGYVDLAQFVIGKAARLIGVVVDSDDARGSEPGGDR